MVFLRAGDEIRPLCMLSKYSPTELHYKATTIYFNYPFAINPCLSYLLLPQLAHTNLDLSLSVSILMDDQRNKCE